MSVNEYTGEITKKGIGKIILANKNGTTPWLPEGFSQVTGTTLDTGLTIANTSDGKPGTQNYVWIEVPTTIKASVSRSGDATEITLAEAQNDSEILEILEVYAGKGTSTNYSNSRWKDEWYDSRGKNKDAAGANWEDTAGCGMTKDEYEATYNRMLNSIKKYGGFWLAQYEAGIAYEKDGQDATNRKSHSDITITKANYAKDQYPYNFVYCSEAQKIANADSTSSYTSSLLFGIQWNLVCKFLEIKTNVDYKYIAKNSTWGNYYNTGWTSSTSSKYSDNYGENFKEGSKAKTTGEYLLTTGAIEATTESVDASPMDIYDFEGNVWEWTLEYSTDTVAPCAYRGGCYVIGHNYSAAGRLNYITTAAHNNLGFRSTLY